MNNPLIDKDFLKKLNNTRNKEKYVKLILLDWNENPIEELTGIATAGNITCDGSSTVRQTCSITMINNNPLKYTADWSLNKKFKVYIGLKNEINSQYDNIIWFPRGVYVISGFSQSSATTSSSISIQGKDKMCLLNGDIDGKLTATHEFEYEYNSITQVYDRNKIYDIIRTLVRDYAHQKEEEIIINDLPDGYDILNYRGGNSNLYIYKQNNAYQILFSNTPPTGTGIELIKTVVYGQTAGYRSCDLVYPQELKVSAGTAATNVLDQIISALGNYEYFFDNEGHFIFQEKRNFLNSLYSSKTDSEVEKLMSSIYGNQYSFTNNQLISSITNTPVITNIKNDYVIWGQNTNKKSIHYRYIIEKKPTTTNTIPWQEQLYQEAVVQKLSKWDYLYADMEAFWRDLYDPELWDANNHWNPSYFNKDGEKINPEDLLFYIDFNDSAELTKYRVSTIGHRPYVENKTTTKAVEYLKIPDVIFTTNDIAEEGEVHITASQESLFSISSQGVSCIERIEDLLYTSTYFNESKTLSIIPIYYLEPNTLIELSDGEYVIKSISYPLAYNGLSSISCSKVVNTYKD